jgi:hypothetical protein
MDSQKWYTWTLADFNVFNLFEGFNHCGQILKVHLQSPHLMKFLSLSIEQSRQDLKEDLEENMEFRCSSKLDQDSLQPFLLDSSSLVEEEKPEEHEYWEVDSLIFRDQDTEKKRQCHFPSLEGRLQLHRASPIARHASNSFSKQPQQHDCQTSTGRHVGNGRSYDLHMPAERDTQPS